MWVGRLSIASGSKLIGLAYDSEELGQLLRRSLEPWINDRVDSDRLPIALSVSAPRRDRHIVDLGRLEYGCDLLLRSRSLEQLVDGVKSLVVDLGKRADSNLIRVPLRVFVREGRAVLAAVLTPKLVSDRRLSRLGISEIMCWRASVSPEGQVRIGGDTWDLAGIVAEVNTNLEMEQILQELWLTAETGREPWARLLWGVSQNEAVFAEPDVRQRLIELLS